MLDLNFSDYFENDYNDMEGCDIQTIVASRLEDMADQVYHLIQQGMYEEAELLKQEGLQLAEAIDNGTVFLYLNDLTEV